MTLNEVIKGLKKGQTYERNISDILDILRPLPGGFVEHTVINTRTGAGGSDEYQIDTLRNGNWPQTHWSLRQ